MSKRPYEKAGWGGARRLLGPRSGEQGEGESWFQMRSHTRNKPREVTATALKQKQRVLRQRLLYLTSGKTQRNQNNDGNSANRTSQT